MPEQLNSRKKKNDLSMRPERKAFLKGRQALRIGKIVAEKDGQGAI